ncbi:MAG: type I glutamate--ammonia ligase, partial [Planctomycetia bacterium]|nr:type I glutamate--ammonia ligase [Planctomycetia bacterium]
AHEGYFHVDSVEAEWNRGRAEAPNLGHKLRHKEGYFPCPPSDQLMDVRNEMMLTMIQCGIDVEAQHHEVATAGQCEIDMRFQELVRMADQMCLYKYIVKNVARRHGKTVTFMPKPIFGDNGSGMHTHISLWKDGHPLFAGSGYAGLSEMALFALGGILRHAPALLAITNPTTNSYKRLVPGYEAPVNLAYSQRNRSASCRIPMYSASPKTKRIEFRCPDPTCNPYLSFAAILLAAIDGIQNKFNPGPPLDRDIYDLPPEELAKVPKAPGSLDEALAALERDHDFLLRGDVFTDDVIATWIRFKREKEIDPMRLRPHPYEFCLYFDT